MQPMIYYSSTISRIHVQAKIEFSWCFMISKQTLALISVIFITGCAQTQIYHPSKPLHMYDIDKSECTNLVNQSNPAYDDSTRQCAYVGTTLQCRNNDPMIASTRAFQNSLRAFEVRDEVTKCMERRGWRQEVIHDPIKGARSTSSKEFGCQSSGECPQGMECRSRRGGGTECRERVNVESAERIEGSVECKSREDCSNGMSCRSKKKGGGGLSAVNFVTSIVTNPLVFNLYCTG